MVVILVSCAVAGLLLGSFANVVVYRVPRGGSLVSPPSQCPSCGSPIRHRHNVPVLGWLVLRGRCADCRAGISARYPLVEAGTAVVFVALTLRLDRLDLLPAVPAFLYLAVTGVVLALIDVDCRRLPDVIVLPSYPVALLLLAAAAGWQDDWGGLGRAALGGAALLCLYVGIVTVHPAGMGWGDVKLAGLLGAGLAYLSWGTLVVGAFAGFLLGSLAGAVVIATRGGNGKTALPFGPFMLAGGLLAVFVGDAATSGYLHLLGR